MSTRPRLSPAKLNNVKIGMINLDRLLSVTRDASIKIFLDVEDDHEADVKVHTSLRARNSKSDF